MYKQDHSLHFIGIGGVGMAGIAEVLLNLGYRVSGSDVKVSRLSENLRELGANIYYGHHEDNIPAETGVVVVSSAIQPENVELLAATNRSIPVIPRSEMLAELMRMKYGIAVAGSHGKTTTTSMIAKILSDGGLQPTVIVGGQVLSKRSGAQIGTGKYLVAESDESDGSFCLLRPAIAVVTNIDREHLSFYGSFGALEKAFSEFMSSVPFYGVVVACFDDPVVVAICKTLKRRVISYGLSSQFDYSVSDIAAKGLQTAFQLERREAGEGGGRHGAVVTLPMPGRHFALNAVAAIAVGLELGLSLTQCVETLATFPGVSRRSEVLLHERGIYVIDDYAHHPREIQATLAAIRSALFPSREQAGRLTVLFEPHRYSRVRELFSEFLNAFVEADRVLVGDIYPAGEEPLPGISAEALAQAMPHPSVRYEGDLAAAIPGLVSELRAGDVVVAVGAGNVTKVAHQLASELKGRRENA